MSNIPSITWGMFLEYLLIAKKWIEKYKDKVPPNEWQVGAKGDVLLIPGFQETWVFLRTPANFLNSKGYRIHVITEIEPNIYSASDNLFTIKKYIEKETLKNFIILTHSKGGVIARHLLSDPQVQKRIKRVFIISSPNQGTLWGYLSFRHAHEFTPVSQIIKTLSTGTKKIINIYPKIDNHVIPNKNLFLAGAINKEIDIFGHTRILESEETQKVIAKYL